MTIGFMDDEFLFDIESLPTAEIEQRFRNIDTPLWTRNKARFIARYLNTFTFVTKHGTYIDAFAGPQHEDSREESWAAKLVMENRPAWIRNFYLFEKDPKQVSHLEDLKSSYLAEVQDGVRRQVEVQAGDCNVTLPEFLAQNPIREKEATFCLFDQRSTECDWTTVKSVASHKGGNGGRKIEIFYFLAQGWIDRAIKSWRNDAELRCKKWWGRDDVESFLNLSSFSRGKIFASRFKNELGYRFALPFPIQKEGERGMIMFWMIHASDHERAPVLMTQAYRHIGAGGGVHDPIIQGEFFDEV